MVACIPSSAPGGIGFPAFHVVSPFAIPFSCRKCLLVSSNISCLEASDIFMILCLCEIGIPVASIPATPKAFSLSPSLSNCFIRFLIACGFVYPTPAVNRHSGHLLKHHIEISDHNGHMHSLLVIKFTILFLKSALLSVKAPLHQIQ